MRSNRPLPGGVMLAALVFLVVAVIAAAGCSRPRLPGGRVGDAAKAVGTAGERVAAATTLAAVAEPMRPFFAAGLGFIVVGGVGIALGARRFALILLVLGVATTATGVLFVRYPWAVLLLALPLGGVVVYSAVDSVRARRQLARNQEALAATAEVIQNLPEGKSIKNGLSALGAETEQRIREVLSPIKDRLRREGKIES